MYFSTIQGNEPVQKSYTDGCQCGAVQYELTGVQQQLYVVIVRSVKDSRGSAFEMALLIKENGLKLSGELKIFERISNAGNRVTAYVCPNCGVRI